MKSSETFCRLSLAVCVVAFATGVVRAEWLEEASVRAAAAAFSTRDAIGSSVLKGRALRSLDARDALWIAQYEPSGYAVFSGSDLFGPVVTFSDRDYVEPDEGTAFYDILEGSSEGCRNAEDAGETDAGLRRRAKWQKLIVSAKLRMTVLRGESEGGSSGVEPFLSTRWDQWQPYNDFCPIYDTEDQSDAYRGRVPCGCVAVSASQILNYWKWPARIDESRTYDHTFIRNKKVGTYTMRFDGHVLIDWDAMKDEYESYDGGHDLRGRVAESVRFPIAKLMLFCDSLAEMTFDYEGSSAVESIVVRNSPWYTGGIYRERSDGYEAAIAALKDDIFARRPVFVGIPGHSVVAAGWREDGDTRYVWFNYGWGGDSDGWYNIDDDESESRIEDVSTSFRPRLMAQLDPLPRMCNGDVALRWHFPDCYAGRLNGFTVRAARIADATSTYTDDFSSSEGIFSGDGFAITRDSSYSSGGNLLRISAKDLGSYTFQDVVRLTSTSVLTFMLYSSYTLGAELRIEARFDGGDWVTVSVPELKSKSSAQSTIRVDLGSHAGQMVQFRILNDRNSLEYYADGKILIDDFSVINAYQTETPAEYRASAADRRASLTGLEPGAGYVFTVLPDVPEDLKKEATASSPVFTTIAGGDGAGFGTATGMPSIDEIFHSKSPVAEGLFAECSMGGNVFSVTCSPSVVSLSAHVSAASYVPDSAVKVYGLGDGAFVVTVDASGVPSWAKRTRAILTLAATDGNGTTAYRDVSLRFSTETESGSYDSDVPPLEPDPPAPPEPSDPFTEAGLEKEYELRAGIAPDVSDVFDVVVARGWKIAVSGLPAGLKYDSKNGAITGVATKEVTSTVTFTATRGSGKSAEKETATAVFRVVFPEVSVAPEAYDDAAATDGAKISGAGRYPFGKKVTLKATPGKGRLFLGWYDDAGAIVTKAASYSFVMPEENVALKALFVTAAEDRASIAATVNGEKFEADGEGAVATHQTNVWAGVYMEWPVAAEALTLPTTVKVSGLPSGLKFTTKPVTSKIGSGKTAVTVTNVPANTIYGVPTAASKVNARTGVVTPSAVKVTVTTAGKSSQTYQINTTVDALPAWATGAFEGGRKKEEGRSEEGRSEEGIDGLVSLTVAASGKISGKMMADGLTWTLSATSFTDVESPSSDVESPTFHASVIGKSGKLTFTNALAITAEAFGADGARGVGVLTGDVSVAVYQNLWKTEPWKTTAKQFAKAKALEIPLDGGAVTLKFASSGAVTAKGVFGKYSASCSSVLIPQDDGEFVVFLYFPPKAGKFEGYAGIVRLVWDGAAFGIYQQEEEDDG